MPWPIKSHTMLSSDFHKDFARLIITTHEITSGGLSFSEQIKPDALNCLIAEKNHQEFSWLALENITPEFYLERESKVAFKLRLKADFILQNSCLRCLKPVSHPLPIDMPPRLIEG